MSRRPPTALIRDHTGVWLRFMRPCAVRVAQGARDVIPTMVAVEKAVEADGLHAAGFVAYEAAPAFDSCLRVRPGSGFPAAWFALFDRPPERVSLPACPAARAGELAWQPALTPGQYRAAVRRIKRHIRDGDTYQVNYTYRMHAACAEDPWRLFLALAATDDPPCGAFIDAGSWAVCSASPELFFSLNGSRLVSRPMKGTAPRGLWHGQDRGLAAALAASAKDRAENIMITDMVRNDLGRVAAAGSVRTTRLCGIEQYPTVWQMTSTVQASTRRGLTDVFRALFPPASITGAPKARTMELIAAIESTPRRIYTGAIGCIAPGRQARFSVAIRTVLVNRREKRAEYGVGGGIVWDSRPARELEESRIKARVLKRPPPAFDLLETMLWTPERGCWLLAYHLRRLAQSAGYFGFRHDAAAVRKKIGAFAARLPRAPHRLRLLAGRSGAVDLTARRLEPAAAAFPAIGLAAGPVDTENPFLYHKTTCRAVYAEALKQVPGAADVLLYNARGEVTESTIANVAIDLRGRLVTPPVRCGLLAGTLRACLLDRGFLQEQAVPITRLLASPRVLLLNSVRGMQQVRIVAPNARPR